MFPFSPFSHSYCLTLFCHTFSLRSALVSSLPFSSSQFHHLTFIQALSLTISLFISLLFTFFSLTLIPFCGIASHSRALSFSHSQPCFLPPNPLSRSIFSTLISLLVAISSLYLSSPLIDCSFSLYSLSRSLFYSPSSCASLSLSSILKSSRDVSLLFSFQSRLLSLFSTLLGQ